jgi:hypothetical protein
MPRKTTDPRIVELRDRQDKARAAFVRWYLRMRRAVNAMEAQRQAVARLDRRIGKLEAEGGPPKG